MNEVCICAAVKSEDGRIFRGHRHSDCFNAMRLREVKPSSKPCAQGFITSKNRYVDRPEGYALQISAGIKSVCTEGNLAPNGYWANGELYSEDLY